MLKDMPNIRYTFEGKQLALKGLCKQVKKRPGRVKILASCLVTIGGDKASCQTKVFCTAQKYKELAGATFYGYRFDR